MVKTTLSLVGLVVAGAVFFLYTQPSFEDIRAFEARISGYNEALERATELQQLKQSLLSRYNAFDPSNIERLRKLLPDHVDNVRLVLDLDNLAARHGMALQNVVISDPTDSDIASGTISASGRSRQKYDSLVLRFNTQGTYENFVAFLGELESSLRLVDLVELELDRLSGVPTQGQQLYRFNITLQTYWLK